MSEKFSLVTSLTSVIDRMSEGSNDRMLNCEVAVGRFPSNKTTEVIPLLHAAPGLTQTIEPSQFLPINIIRQQITRHFYRNFLPVFILPVL